MILVVTVVIGFSIHTLFPAIDTWLIRQLDPTVRESAYASFTSASLLIESSGPTIVGLLLTYGIGYDAIFRFGAVLVLFMLLVMAGLTASMGGGQRSAKRA